MGTPGAISMKPQKAHAYTETRHDVQIAKIKLVLHRWNPCAQGRDQKKKDKNLTVAKWILVFAQTNHRRIERNFAGDSL